jgi:hypothetical protein
MLTSVLTVGLALVPFILVFSYAGSGRLRGFVHVFIGVIAFHIVVALTTQALHIFTYPLILWIHILAAIVCLVAYLIIIRKKGLTLVPIPSSRFSASWFPVVAFVIVFFELFTVHYHYTGIVSDISGFSTVTDSAYQYPYYSDEWVGVSFTEHSIRNHSLPLTNPLAADAPFANPLVVFYSFVAEIFLFLGLNPLTGWALLALANGLLVCLFIYLALRASKVSPFAASVAVLAVPLLVNGTNLPGIWYLVPFLGSLVVFLAGLTLSIIDDVRTTAAAYFLALILYPPMIIFVVPAGVAMAVQNKKLFSRESLRVFGIGLAVIAAGAAVLVLLLLSAFHLNEIIRFISSWIVRSDIEGGIPSLAIWNIMPISLLAAVAIGILVAVKRKSYVFLFPIAAGVIFWTVYAFVLGTFIMDYSRIASITAILMMLLAGLGIEGIMKTISRRISRPLVHILTGAVFLSFAIFVYAYPVGSGWSKLVLQVSTPAGVEKVAPSAPINRYLTSDDLRLFTPFHQQYFLAPPWKGLVIGVATGNYPSDSKASTITNSFLQYADFLDADCITKSEMVQAARVSLVYSAPLSCPQFEKIGESSEHFYLYRPVSSPL